MKRIITIAAVLFWGLAALAQTPQEIVARMEANMESPEVYTKNGLAFTMDMKMPIVGTVTSRAYSKGDNIRMDVIKNGKTVATTWRDGKTEWTYDAEKNTVEIKKDATAPREEKKDSDIAMFEGVADGYTVSLRKETANAWYLRCKRNRSNGDKDDPKTMDLVVEKGTYKPLSLSAKVSIVSVTIRDLVYGVSDDKLVFRASDYPTATITDNR